MSKQKIAVIGIGKIAIDQHLPVIDKSKHFEVAATVSTRLIQHRDLPVFKTPAELYAALPKVELVAICTPPGVRHAFVREALDAGKHVLMEKPPTTTISEFDDLVAHGKKTEARSIPDLAQPLQRGRRRRQKDRPPRRHPLGPRRLARERAQMAPRPGLGVGAGRLRRLRSRHQRAVDPHQGAALPGVRRKCNPGVPVEPPDPGRRRHRLQERRSPTSPRSPPASTGSRKTARSGPSFLKR